MQSSDVICTGLSLRAQANRCRVQLVPKKFIAQLERGSLHPLQCWPPLPFLMSHELPVYLLLPAVSAFSLPEQSQKHMLLQTQVQCAQTFGAKLLQGTKFFPFFFSSSISRSLILSFHLGHQNVRRITGCAVKQRLRCSV